MEIASEEGLQALSMRRIADRLGVGTMALYTHVPGRSELLDLMIDQLYSEIYRVPDPGLPIAQPGGWRERVEFVASENLKLLQRHPWATDMGARPAIGPNLVRKYEAELAPLDGIGLSDVEIDATLTLVLNHVTAVARVADLLGRARAELSDDEWWLSHEHALTGGISWELGAFPLASRIGQAASEAAGGVLDIDLTFRFGLDRILDGVALLLERRR